MQMLCDHEPGFAQDFGAMGASTWLQHGSCTRLMGSYIEYGLCWMEALSGPLYVEPLILETSGPQSHEDW